MRWLATARAGQIATGVLILVVVRSLAEFFRLGGGVGNPATAEHVLYIQGALAAAVAAGAALLLHALRRDAAASGTAIAAVVGLLLWKVFSAGL